MARFKPWGASLSVRQRGQAFIISVLILAIGVGALIYNLATPAKLDIEKDKKTAAALAQAKDALIGYAAGQASGGSYRPGELPCPDTNNDGNEESTCDSPTSRIGRLPWKKLGLPDLRDGSGERLWYAVSNVFKNASQVGVLNSDTPGDYAVTGISPANNVIAIVFAPGAVLGNQVRDTANANNVANYLEGENANGDTVFTTALPSSTFNDRLLLITRETFFPTVEMRVAREIRSSLRSYYTTNRYYPFAAQFPGSTSTMGVYRGNVPTTTCAPVPAPTFPTWFSANNWYQVMVYAVAPRCTPKITTTWISIGTAPPCAVFCLGPIFGLYTCLMPDAIDTSTLDCSNTTAGPYLTVTGIGSSIEAAVLPAGYGLSGQTRPCTSAASCLEDQQNTDGPGNYPNVIDGVDNYTYVKPQKSTTNNDNLVIVRP